MFEVDKPLRALLAGTLNGKFIKRLIGVHDPGDHRAQDRGGRPRVQVTDGKLPELTCQICMGKIKGELEYAYCDKRSFHRACLDRMHGCPYCKLTYAIRGRESTTSREVRQPFAQKPTSEEEPQTIEASPHCPVCGERIVKDAERCSVCGAIFVIDGGSFSCPACGSSVGESEAGCPNCGEHFRQFTPRTCPVCGRPVGQNEEKCQCGAIMGDKCPECGASLAQEDTVCANCGAAFEFI